MSNLLINEPPLMVLPSLAIRIGLNEAIVLQQIHYWLNPKINKNFKENRYWVHNSYEQWKEQFGFWSVDTIKRTITSLEKLSLLFSKNFNSSSFDKTKWYTINYDKLNEVSICTDRSVQNAPSSGSKCTMDEGKLPLSYIDTEITTEITSSPLTPQTISDDKNRGGEGIKKENDRNGNLSKAAASLSPTIHAPLSFQVNPLAQEMVSIWKEVVLEGQGESPYLRESRQSNLLKAFSEYFESNMNNWKEFCRKIASSKFLMGETKEKFSTKLDWAIRPVNIEKILEGSITLGDRIPQKEQGDDTWEKAKQLAVSLKPEILEQYRKLYEEEQLSRGYIPDSKNFRHFVVAKIREKLID